MPSIAENLASVEAAILAACQRAGRPRQEVTLVAVSKTKPASDIAEAIAAGQRHFGENKVQELAAKAPLFAPEVSWHLIGPLQSNKARKALACCGLLHTLDSVELGERLHRIAAEENRRCRALLQVNISRDPAKHGFAPEAAARALEALQAFDRLHIGGLMTITRLDPDPEAARRDFASLRQLRDQIAPASGLALRELSMGMSHDFHVAIEEGATLVRVGSAIFGERI